MHYGWFLSAVHNVSYLVLQSIYMYLSDESEMFMGHLQRHLVGIEANDLLSSQGAYVHNKVLCTSLLVYM